MGAGGCLWGVQGPPGGGPYPDGESPYEEGEHPQQCLLAPGMYTLRCEDSYGDGWHGGALVIDGIEYCSGFDDGGLQEELTFISSAAAGETLFPLPCAPLRFASPRLSTPNPTSTSLCTTPQ